MKSKEEIQTIIVIIYLIVLFGAILIALLLYNKYVDLKNEENKSSGNWHGGTFFANPEIVIPIEDKTDNQTLQKIISRHKKVTIFFWVWILILVPIIIILNLVD